MMISLAAEKFRFHHTGDYNCSVLVCPGHCDIYTLEKDVYRLNIEGRLVGVRRLLRLSKITQGEKEGWVRYEYDYY